MVFPGILLNITVLRVSLTGLRRNHDEILNSWICMKATQQYLENLDTRVKWLSLKPKPNQEKPSHRDGKSKLWNTLIWILVCWFRSPRNTKNNHGRPRKVRVKVSLSLSSCSSLHADYNHLKAKKKQRRNKGMTKLNIILSMSTYTEGKLSLDQASTKCVISMDGKWTEALHKDPQVFLFRPVWY